MHVFFPLGFWKLLFSGVMEDGTTIFCYEFRFGVLLKILFDIIKVYKSHEMFFHIFLQFGLQIMSGIPFQVCGR